MEKLGVGPSHFKTDSQHAETLGLKLEKGCIRARPVGAPFQAHGGFLEDSSVALNLRGVTAHTQTGPSPFDF